MSEDHDTRLKRLRMRSWRRGTKEMDLILGPYADDRLATMAGADLDLYEALLEENDQDLYPWVSGRIGGVAGGPPALAALLDDIAAHAAGKIRGA